MSNERKEKQLANLRKGLDKLDQVFPDGIPFSVESRFLSGKGSLVFMNRDDSNLVLQFVPNKKH
ncbi:hypothetical protein THMIRHAS_17150 [Thiosulfatimonas sediminis]|uniref:Uncharacterized protein n=1 Tax=Thiosulfatimonas sediminis TaxID=2675054 RepID=A0A6F8PW15_9GAMM|nr:hypothetical protein [Thiosulfatimonas sediminis]BBP46342.1 hypothetical protein THMIRHAS_17150 [Thiosulfatimonas sediminis]